MGEDLLRHDELGSILAQDGKMDEGAAQFSEALRLKPDYAAAKLHLGVIRWQQKSNDEALALLQSAVQLEPNNAQCHYYLARVLEENNQRR